MTAPAHAAGHWATAHRTALLVLLVAAALVAAITVVTLRLVSSAVPVTGGASTSQTQQLGPDVNTCTAIQPGTPC
jgi:amino acid transporter